MKHRSILQNKLRVTGLVVAVACMFSTFATFSAAFNHLVTKKRDFEGQIKAELCRKGADGRWEVFDTLVVPSVRLSASLTELTSGKDVNSEFTFQGKSAEGRQINVRMKRAGRGTADLKEGRVGLDLPLELTIDGKTSSLVLALTTESAQAADGTTINGSRAKIDVANRTATLSMVGNAKFQSLIRDGTSNTRVEDLKLAQPSELLVVIRSSGKLTAVDH